MSMCSGVHMVESMNHNSLSCEQQIGLDVGHPLHAQDTFRPMPGLISCTVVTGRGHIACEIWAQPAELPW